MAGRKPTPTKLKLLRGNPGKRSLPKNEPKPAPVVSLEPPFHLSDDAKLYWRDLAPMLARLQLLTEGDVAALELLCETRAEWRQADDAIRDEGVVYETSTETGSTIVRPRPEVAMRAGAAMRIRQLLVEFGLTPSARSKVTPAPKGEEDPLEKFLGAGRRGA